MPYRLPDVHTTRIPICLYAYCRVHDGISHCCRAFYPTYLPRLPSRAAPTVDGVWFHPLRHRPMPPAQRDYRTVPCDSPCGWRGSTRLLPFRYLRQRPSTGDYLCFRPTGFRTTGPTPTRTRVTVAALFTLLRCATLHAPQHTHHACTLRATRVPVHAHHAHACTHTRAALRGTTPRIASASRAAPRDADA